MHRRLSSAVTRHWRAALLLLAVAFVTWNAAAGDEYDDDDDEASGAAVEVVDGRTRLRFDPAALERFGIAIESVARERQAVEEQVVGEILDVGAIIDLGETIERARADRSTARDMGEAQRAVLARYARMGESGIAVDQVALARAQRELRRYAADERAAAVMLHAAEARARQTWGPQIGERIIRGGDSLVAQLVAGDVRLVSVALPNPAAAGGAMFVAASGHRADAVAGNWLGPAPRNLTPLGTSFLAAVDGGNFRPGMRVSVWLSRPGASVEGLRVPRRALVWHAGERWTYVELEPGLLERRAADVLVADDDHVVIAAPDESTERIVVSGAPSLLGEEFRWSIPDEDDD